MVKIQSKLSVLLFVATALLLANDIVRLALTFDPGSFAAQECPQEQEEENKPFNPFSNFEEELKHKDIYPTSFLNNLFAAGIESSVSHLIKDDEVCHLAYLDIFSPPPDLA